MDINATSCQDPRPVIEITGYIGAAQHTYTRACDGHHQPGPCKLPVVSEVIYPGTVLTAVVTAPKPFYSVPHNATGF